MGMTGIGPEGNQGAQQPWQGAQQPWPGAQPPGPGYAAPRQRVRPGRVWYLVPLALFIAGLAWLSVGLASLSNTVNDLQRVPLPAGGTVNLTHSGGYTIYYEGPGAQNGNIPAFHVFIAPVPPSTSLPHLSKYGSTVTYDIGSHQGRAVLSLNVSKPGKFAVKAVGAPSNGSDLAFGGSIGSGIVGALLPAIPLMIIGVLGALVLLIIRIVRKRSLQRGYAA